MANIAEFLAKRGPFQPRGFVHSANRNPIRFRSVMIDQRPSRIDPVNGVIWLVLFNLTVLQETRTQMQVVYSIEAILFSVLVLKVSALDLVRMSRKVLFLPSLLLVF